MLSIISRPIGPCFWIASGCIAPPEYFEPSRRTFCT